MTYMEANVAVVSARAAFPSTRAFHEVFLFGMNLVVTGLVQAMGPGTDVFSPVYNLPPSDGGWFLELGKLWAPVQTEGPIAKVVRRIKTMSLPYLFHSFAESCSLLIEIVFLRHS